MIGTRPQPLVCPDCGLEFVVVHTREGLALYYEFRDWDDACWRSRVAPPASASSRRC